MSITALPPGMTSSLWRRAPWPIEVAVARRGALVPRRRPSTLFQYRGRDPPLPGRRLAAARCRHAREEIDGG
ncbi:hypothetical protein U9M48_042376 [Paspalum notatum var. saurae]|uniref:Uncharacterized protein n=1 Tax=Paspalum notatum var. saurae TaxID=547442 RepID=A0AAQ3UV62_PASNO